MARSDGRLKTIEGFGSEHEANAWIIQAQRLIRATGPWTPLAPRKPHVAGGMQPAPVHDGPDGGAIRRSHVRGASQRSVAKP